MKNLKENKSGQANLIILAIFTVIMGFGMLTIGTYVYYSIAGAADAGTRIAVVGHTASANINISGNVSDGNLVNITNGGTFRFEFNATYPSPVGCATANCIIVNVYNSNNSLGATTNLTAAINGNASTAALVTATTVTGTNGYNYTVITSKARGTTANSYGITETGTNIAVSSSTLLGGINDITGQTSQNSLNNYVSVTFPLFGLALMILGFGVIFITLKKSFGAGR